MTFKDLRKIVNLEATRQQQQLLQSQQMQGDTYNVIKTVETKSIFMRANALKMVVKSPLY
jgi:hypothetical protein